MSILLSSKRTFLLIQACGGKNFIENFIFKHKMSENVIWCKSFRLFWRLASSLLSQEKSLSLGILFSPFTLTQTLGGSKIVKEVGGTHNESMASPLPLMWRPWSIGTQQVLPLHLDVGLLHPIICQDLRCCAQHLCALLQWCSKWMTLSHIRVPASGQNTTPHFHLCSVQNWCVHPKH